MCTLWAQALIADASSSFDITCHSPSYSPYPSIFYGAPGSFQDLHWQPAIRHQQATVECLMCRTGPQARRGAGARVQGGQACLCIRHMVDCRRSNLGSGGIGWVDSLYVFKKPNLGTHMGLNIMGTCISSSDTTIASFPFL